MSESDSDVLKQVIAERATENGIYDALKKKLQVHEHDGIRTSLRCIDILGIRDRLVCMYIAEVCAEHSDADSLNLAEPNDVVPHDSDSTSIVTRLVEYSLKCLKNKPWGNQEKCVRILSALSQTGRLRLPLSSLSC